MSKNREQKHAKHLAERQAHEEEVHDQEVAEHHDHFVEAPKGTSRARFLFNFLLVVFLLLIFSITGPMMAALSRGGGSDEVYLSYTLPNGEQRTFTGAEFIQAKRDFGMLEPLFPALGFQGVDPGDDEAAAKFLILEDMARLSGVSAPSSDLADFILALFGDRDSYLSYIASRRSLTPAVFEGLLRRGRTVQIYRQLMSIAPVQVSPDKIAEQWQTQNQEYDFQYVRVENADYDEAARAALPGPEELQDWFDALSPFEKSRFNTQPSWSADLAFFDVASDADMSVLFERYPRPEDEDAEEMANNYYNSFSHVRFLRPAPEDGGELEGDKFLSFDEVADVARREAPIYYSLSDWLTDMQVRLDGGEVVDLATEATALGLAFVQVDPRTRDAWAAGEEPWAGETLAASTSALAEGRLATRVVVEEGALVVAQAIERLAPSQPPFDEIREQVADKWVEQRRSEVAVEALESLRAAFEEAPADETEAENTPATPRKAMAELEAFKAAVEAAGLELVERGYASRYPRPGEDPEARGEVDNYLQNTTRFYTLEPGEIAEPESSRDGVASYLVRFGGKRDMSLDQMDPGELQQLQATLGRSALTTFFGKTWDDERWIRETFALYLRSEDEAPPSN